MRTIHKTLCVFLIILTAAFVFFHASATSSKKSTVYSVSNEYAYPQNLQIFSADDTDFLLLSKSGDHTLLSRLNVQNGTARVIASLDTPYSAAVFQQGVLWIAVSTMTFSNIDSTFQPSTLFLRYGVSDDTVKQWATDKIFIDTNSDFAVDSNENLYLINGSDRRQIKIFSSNGAHLGDWKNSEDEFTSVKSNPDGTLLYTATNSQTALTVYSPGDFTQVTSVLQPVPTLPYSFLDNSTIFDKSGCIRSIKNSSSLQYQYRVSGENFAAYNGMILASHSDGQLYLYRQSDGQAVGQYSVKSNDVLSLGLSQRYALAASRSENAICVEIFSADNPEPIVSPVYLPSDHVFSASPIGVCSAEQFEPSGQFSPNTLWQVTYDNTVFSAGEHGFPRAVITNLDSGAEYVRTINNGATLQEHTLFFTPPDDLVKPHNAASHYKIQVKNLYTSKELPAVLEYTVTVSMKSSSSSQPADSSDRISSKNYGIQNNTISGIAPSTTLSDFKNNLTGSGTFRILDQNRKQVKSGTVGTGMTVQLLQGDKICDTAAIVVCGDLTGEGNCNSRDLQLIYQYLLTKRQLDSPYLQAADCNHDGTVNTLDLLAMDKFLSGTYDIDQK